MLSELKEIEEKIESFRAKNNKEIDTELCLKYVKMLKPFEQ